MRKTKDAGREVIDSTAYKAAIQEAQYCLTIKLPEIPGLDVERFKAVLFASSVFSHVGATDTASLGAALRVLTYQGEKQPLSDILREVIQNGSED